MSFADPTILHDRARAGRVLDATVEVGRAGSKAGIIIRIHGIRNDMPALRDFLAGVLHYASRTGRSSVHPGRWAALVCAYAFDAELSAEICRGDDRSRCHAALIIPSPSAATFPEWPAVRCAAPGVRGLELHDLRSGRCREVPTDADLLALGDNLDTLRDLFDAGLYRWAQQGRRWILEANA